MLPQHFQMCFDGSFSKQLAMLGLSTNWRYRSCHSKWSFNAGHSLDHWEYLDFLMPLTEITMMALHREAWQCSWQNRGSDLQGMECRMEVQLTMKARRLRRQCSPHRGRVILLHEMIWFMSVSPWIVDGHIWWSCKLPHEDWCEEPGLKPQEWFIYLNKRRPSTWLLCCEREPVPEVFMILRTFQTKIAW